MDRKEPAWTSPSRSSETGDDQRRHSFSQSTSDPRFLPPAPNFRGASGGATSGSGYGSGPVEFSQEPMELSSLPSCKYGNKDPLPVPATSGGDARPVAVATGSNAQWKPRVTTGNTDISAENKTGIYVGESVFNS